MLRDGVCSLPALLGGDALALLQRYVALRMATGSMRRERGIRAYGSYGDMVVESLFAVVEPALAPVFPEPVVPSYGYLRVYEAGARLPPHTDREGCEYTLSLAISATDDGARWPLHARDTADADRACPLELGDAVLMMGREVLHWREPLASGSAAFAFLHWVCEATHAARPFDGRPGLGFRT